MAIATEIKMQFRCCPICHVEHPLDAEHFHRHAGYPGGFRSTCKQCRNAKRMVDRQERYGKAVKTLLLRAARDISAGRIGPGHLAVMNILAGYLGGAEGIAKTMSGILSNPRASLRQQLTILMAIQKMTERVDDARRTEAAQHSRELGQMSRPELEVYILQRSDELLREHGLKIVPIDEE